MWYRRVLAVIILVITIATLAYLNGSVVFPALFGIGLVIALMPAVRFYWSPVVLALVSAVFAGVFLLEAFVWPLPQRTFSPLMSATTARGVAQFFVAVQILLLARYKEALPRYYPLIPIVALTFTGSVIDYSRMYFGFEVSAVAVGVLLVFFFMAPSDMRERVGGRPGFRYVILRGIGVICVLTLALSVAYLLRRYQDDLDLLFTRLVNLRTTTVAAGLSDSSQLNSISNLRTYHSDDVALSVASAEAPGYLRSRVFSSFYGNQWGSGVNRWHREPVGTAGGTHRGRNLFPIRKASLEGAKTMEMWPARLLGGRLLAPLDAAAFAMNAPRILLDDNKAAEAVESLPGESYVVYVPESMPPQPLHDATLRAALDVPGSISTPIRDLAQVLFEGRDTPEEKMAAVLEHFSAYQYRLNTTVPHHEDPLTYFLTQRPPGHCEFFASGAAILLRLGGVATRYVTGFVPTEYNPFADRWVARNKDAHAWVEVYVPEHGWITIDPTPGAGQPHAVQRSDMVLIWEAVKYAVSEFAALMREDIGAAMRRLVFGLGRVLTAVVLSTWFGRTVGIVVIVVLVIVVVRELRRWRPGLRWRRRGGMSAELRRMERALRRRRVVRGISETLHQFASRIEREHGEASWAREAAAWFREYAIRRFNSRAM